MKYRLYFIIVFFFCGIVTVSSQTRNIVSLAPSLTKMIYLLEAQDNLIGSTGFCEKAIDDGKPVVASQMNVNVEKILSLSPNVIITTDLTAARDLEALKKLGIKVKVFDTPASFKEICEQFIFLGKVTGNKELAASIVEREKSRLDSLRKQIPENNKPEIFMQLGVKPLFTVTPHTFMDDYIIMAGGINIAAGMNIGTITRETVLVKNPDVILIVLMGLVGKDEKQNWKRYNGLKAAENDKILLIDADKACSPTPVTFVDTVEEIIKFVYLE